MDHDSEIITKNFYFRMSGSRRASVISSMGADEIAELFEKLFDNLNQFKFTEAREFISKSAKKLPRKVFMRYCIRQNLYRILTLIRESWEKIQNAGPLPSAFRGEKSRA